MSVTLRDRVQVSSELYLFLLSRNLLDLYTDRAKPKVNAIPHITLAFCFSNTREGFSFWYSRSLDERVFTKKILLVSRDKDGRKCMPRL